MKEKLLQNSYLVIDDFVSEQRAQELAEDMVKTYEQYPESFSIDGQCVHSPAIYDMWQFVELLVEKTPLIASIMEEPMFPTYSYARMYKKHDELFKHIDRGACEVSVTLHLSNDGVEWPIYFETPNKETVQVSLKPGQAVMYLGCVAPHWRNMYKGTDYRQVFLHYVRARGENRHCYFDKRR